MPRLRVITITIKKFESLVINSDKNLNAYLKDNYGEVRDPEFPDLKKLYASIFAHRWSKVYDKYNLIK